jgi:hypothetical protein
MSTASVPADGAAEDERHRGDQRRLIDTDRVLAQGSSTVAVGKWLLIEAPEGPGVYRDLPFQDIACLADLDGKLQAPPRDAPLAIAI